MTAGPATSLLFAGATIRRWPDTEPTNGPFVITDGRVAGLDDASTEASAGSVDVAGLHILLGFVDPHSHLSVAVWVPWFADGSEWESAARALTGVRRAAAEKFCRTIIAAPRFGPLHARNLLQVTTRPADPVHLGH